MGATVTIEGADRVQRMIAQYPKEMTSLIKKALRRAAKPHLSAVRNSVPFPQWKSELTIKAKVTDRKGNIMLSAGIFGVPRDDRQIPAYYKYLWMNYGTLSKRDPQHAFKTPVKKRSEGRSGQDARRMFESVTTNAAEAIAQDVVSTIEKSIDKFEEELNND